MGNSTTKSPHLFSLDRGQLELIRISLDSSALKRRKPKGAFQTSPSAVFRGQALCRKGKSLWCVAEAASRASPRIPEVQAEELRDFEPGSGGLCPPGQQWELYEAGSLPLIRARGLKTKTQAQLSSQAGPGGHSSEFINRGAEAGCSAGSSLPICFCPCNSAVL